MVSIIVPVYNGESYIERCLDSLLNQIYSDIEIIVVDDGSTDRTKEKLDEICQLDQRLRVITQNKQGVSSARNNGIDHANGKYIMFVDSDDWVDNRMVEILVENIETNMADVCLCNMVFEEKNLAEKNELLHKQNGILTETDIKKLVLDAISRLPDLSKSPKYMHCGTPWAKLFRREFILKNNIRFPKHIHIGEDMIFVLDCLQLTNSVSYINCGLYHYINNQSSATRKYNPEMGNWYKDFFQELQIHMIRQNILSGEYALKLGWFAVETLNILMNNYSQRSMCVGRAKEMEWLLKDSEIKKHIAKIKQEELTNISPIICDCLNILQSGSRIKLRILSIKYRLRFIKSKIRELFRAFRK